MKCNGCQAEKTTKGERVPNGWHRLNEDLFCRNCWSERYILRAVTFPVVGPVDGEWVDLRGDLASAWAASTALANWAATELVKNDVIRQAGQKKCPSMPPIYLYGLAVKTYSGWSDWNGAAATANSILRSVEQKYRAARYEIMWTRDRSLMTFRYPFPFPVHNQNWTASTVNQSPTVSITINGRKWMLRLKGGKEMARQLASFRDIEEGRAVKGEMSIYRVRANGGDHRSAVSEADRSAPRAAFRVMVKLVAWLPRREKVRSQGRVYDLETGPDRFLTAADGWHINADFMRTACAEHAVFLDRMSNDTKHEKRWPKRKQRCLNEFRARRCDKQNNRVKTFCQQIAAMVAGRAHRLGFSGVTLNDNDKSYFSDGFPWHQLRTLMATKCDEMGMTFASGEVANQNTVAVRSE